MFSILHAAREPTVDCRIDCFRVPRAFTERRYETVQHAWHNHANPHNGIRTAACPTTEPPSSGRRERRRRQGHQGQMLRDKRREAHPLAPIPPSTPTPGFLLILGLGLVTGSFWLVMSSFRPRTTHPPDLNGCLWQNIDTDQIIPAEYLTLVPSKARPSASAATTVAVSKWLRSASSFYTRTLAMRNCAQIRCRCWIPPCPFDEHADNG